ncbi:hypothetical protein [Hoeflea sp. TYP-13]|uniref:hypothetical protein n=1 Tax=Hoeflea sp. TYP-13 TaxID=3230023 RepID=UPI0034C6C169
MDRIESGTFFSAEGLAALHFHSLSSRNERMVSGSAHPASPDKTGLVQRRQWTLALRRLSRLEHLIELDAPEVILRNEWRLVCAAFSALEKPNNETANGMCSVA